MDDIDTTVEGKRRKSVVEVLLAMRSEGAIRTLFYEP